MRKALKPQPAAAPGRGRERVAMACIIALTLWQGSYFPIQFMSLLALAALGFLLCRGTVTLPPEAGLLAGITVLYIIGAFRFADSAGTALTETLRTLVLPLSLIYFTSRDARHGERAVYAALLAVAILGLLAYGSFIQLPSAVIESSGRLQSVIQYANTTGLLMTVGLLYALARFYVRKTWGGLAAMGLFALALVLTGSRTAFVVALAAVGLYIFLRLGKRARLITLGGAAAVIALLVLAGALMDIRLLRISLYEPTLVERWISFADGARMLEGRWLGGIGPGNWQSWQFRLQSAPYSVKYIHNFYLQLALDCGLPGPVLLLAALVPGLVRGLRAKSHHACVLLAVMLHGVLDFDLIFAAVAMITMLSLSQLTPGGVTLRPGRVRYAAALPLLALAVLMGAEGAAATADFRLMRGQLEASMAANRLALRLNPLKYERYYFMAQSTRDVTETEALLRQAVDKNPADLDAYRILTLIALRDGGYAQALTLTDTLIEGRRFSEDYQALYRDAARQALEAGAISQAEYQRRLAALEQAIASVNPLYTNYILKGQEG